MGERRGYSSSPCAAPAAYWGEGGPRGRATVILAGGAGERMGGGKPDRNLCGRRMIDHAIDCARREGFPMAIGLRRAGQVRADCERVLDWAGVEGPLAALAAGLEWARRTNVARLLTLPCDAPFLPHDLGARLTVAMDRSGAMAAVPMSSGRLHPACALWRVEALSSLCDYLADGRRSLSGFARHVGCTVEDWGAPARDPFFNVNTPEDLALAEGWLRQPHFE
jgi:molybdopterin-guanine dinucleotide biosynthesis protein A